MVVTVNWKDRLVVVALYAILTLVAFVVGDCMAYYWHRWVSHDGRLASTVGMQVIRESHIRHHGGLSEDATEDFVWVVLLMCVVLFSLGSLTTVVPLGSLRGYVVTAVVVAVVVVTLNWYLHMVVHSPEHPLQQVEWVRDLTTIHRVHHRRPDANFSVLNIADPLHGTWSAGL